MQVTLTPMPDADTVAAVLAALADCLEQDLAGAADLPAAGRSAWRSAAVLAGQGLPPARRPGQLGWGSAERARREAGWSQGIVGM